MAETVSIPIETARRLAVSSQRLSGPQLPGTKEGMLELVQRICYLQLDPISVVARTQLIVLWSRLGNFDVALHDELQFQDRALFEYWAPAAAVVPTTDYQLHRRLMTTYPRGMTERSKERIHKWLDDNRALRLNIIKHLREQGPSLSRDIADTSEREYTSGGWNSGRTVAMMLDLMNVKGEVMVAGRPADRSAGL